MFPLSVGQPHHVTEEEGCVVTGAEVAESKEGGGAGRACQRAETDGHPAAAGRVEKGEQVLWVAALVNG